MNHYSWQDLKIGLTHQFERVITMDDMDLFRSLSGDVNPLHAEPEFAAKKGFKSPVVFGMLLASFYSTLAGVYIPGESCLLHGMDVQFIKPAFVGDKLTITGVVSYLNEAYKQAWIQATIVNQLGEEISKAKIKAGVLG